MVRVNLVPPMILSDEHLYAENVELIMEEKFIEKYPDGNVPDTYCLGKGHMSFFRNKPNFIKHRRLLVQQEINRRQQLEYEPFDFPKIKLEWEPTKEDIKINAERIVDRLRNPIKKKTPWHYYGEQIDYLQLFIKMYYDFINND